MGLQTTCNGTHMVTSIYVSSDCTGELADVGGYPQAGTIICFFVFTFDISRFFFTLDFGVSLSLTIFHFVASKSYFFVSNFFEAIYHFFKIELDFRQFLFFFCLLIIF